MSFITTKLLGYVSGGLLLVCLALGATVFLQGRKVDAQAVKLTAMSAAAKATGEALTVALQVANERALQLTGRDVTIQAQTDSIDAISTQRATDRAAYVANIVKADQGAVSNETRAAQIIRIPTPTADRRCQAAADLIREELTNVR